MTAAAAKVKSIEHQLTLHITKKKRKRLSSQLAVAKKALAKAQAAEKACATK